VQQSKGADNQEHATKKRHDPQRILKNARPKSFHLSRPPFQEVPAGGSYDASHRSTTHRHSNGSEISYPAEAFSKTALPKLIAPRQHLHCHDGGRYRPSYQ
jgi:hypothetical protein